ncbi:putative stigma-specific protein Stig1 [Helianthus annuus]|uniref:Stigma-specific protein Stig1 n=1 Tax=Helianthus annuus TaxID=4232 RepID=A0A251SU18_HELAN|nr:stigma-specific STIG1-like protein 2 [Helianthus annuus]KAF5773896.1 putative stigma-specific protein Stig1 [Helianthus annuus]KAJ0477327.1 putative stigma-specific protein Stig1 [Helianthus annuus]KAJ0481748.1 putative stigma-specific protein Stig1 [Helianthus annuus]KAJ0498162.1 putative stigma-specific protein Stig1 [Helianthus annuus]KAJ0664163.1 putative stigma-specific protein Stig1 [Helianthus annuus]
MKIMQTIFLVAITITITSTITTTSPTSPATTRPISRFLADQQPNPRAADHCNKDDEICYVLEGKNSTCCNNKCMDLSEDKHNCGACKKKCKFTNSCCDGGCVNLAYDKRHCGSCGNKCMPGGYCIYGLCNYA